MIDSNEYQAWQVFIRVDLGCADAADASLLSFCFGLLLLCVGLLFAVVLCLFAVILCRFAVVMCRFAVLVCHVLSVAADIVKSFSMIAEDAFSNCCHCCFVLSWDPRQFRSKDKSIYMDSLIQMLPQVVFTQQNPVKTFFKYLTCVFLCKFPAVLVLRRRYIRTLMYHVYVLDLWSFNLLTMRIILYVLALHEV